MKAVKQGFYPRELRVRSIVAIDIDKKTGLATRRRQDFSGEKKNHQVFEVKGQKVLKDLCQKHLPIKSAKDGTRTIFQVNCTRSTLFV